MAGLNGMCFDTQEDFKKLMENGIEMQVILLKKNTLFSFMQSSFIIDIFVNFFEDL